MILLVVVRYRRDLHSKINVTTGEINHLVFVQTVFCKSNSN